MLLPRCTTLKADDKLTRKKKQDDKWLEIATVMNDFSSSVAKAKAKKTVNFWPFVILAITLLLLEN